MKFLLSSAEGDVSQDPQTGNEGKDPTPGFGGYLLIMIGAGLLTGALYYLREGWELEVVMDAFLRCLRMFFVYIVFCIGILIFRYKYKLKDFGIQKQNLLQSTILGVAIYTVPLVMFLSHVGNEDFDSKFVDAKQGLDTGSLVLLSLFVFCMAAMTDIWCRGFVQLITEKYRSADFAFLLQNLVWFIIHIYEIELLKDSFGLVQATALTIFLGAAGGLVANRYRNVLGLGVGHVYLNLVLIIYVAFV